MSVMTSRERRVQKDFDPNQPRNPHTGEWSKVGVGIKRVVTEIASSIEASKSKYVTSSFQINTSLRKNKGDASKISDTKIGKIVSDLDSGMKPSTKRTKLYRGTDSTGSSSSAKSKKDMTGSSWVDDAYTSTTNDEDTALTYFVGGGGKFTTLMVIDVPAGTPQLSLHGRGEGETLLQRGLKHTVTKDHGVVWQSYYHMEEERDRKVRVRKIEVTVETVDTSSRARRVQKDSEIDKRGFDPRQLRRFDGQWTKMLGSLLALATPDDSGPFTKTEKSFIAKVKGSLNLKDGKGPVEKFLRTNLDKIGIDPYDIDLDKLHKHAEDHAKAGKVAGNRRGKSRYWFKSPCWLLRDVDFVSHVLTPAMLEEKHPKLAAKLRGTSPRWSDTKLVSKIRGGMDSPRDLDTKWEFRHGWVPVTAIGNIGKFIKLTDSDIDGVLVEKNPDSTYSVYSDKDKNGLLKDFKTQKGATNFADRLIKADIEAEKKRKFEEALPGKQKARAKNLKDRKKQEDAALAADSEEVYRKPVPVSDENTGKKKRKLSATRVKTTEADQTLTVPHPATHDERAKAGAFASKNYDGVERGYADLIIRLAKKGDVQNPDHRREQSEKRGMKVSRMLAIEQALYREMFPTQGKSIAPKLGSTGPQERAIAEHGGRKRYPLSNISTRINDNHDVLFKANKGEHRGKWLVISPNGEILRKPSNVQALALQKNSKEFVKEAITNGRSAVITRHGVTIDVNSRAWKQEVAAIRQLQDEADFIASKTKAEKISRAKEWAVANGFDPEDSYIWALFNNDPSLLRSQNDGVAGTTEPKTRRGKKGKELPPLPDKAQSALDRIEERLRAAEEAEAGGDDEEIDEPEIDEEEIEEVVEPPRTVKLSARAARKVAAANKANAKALATAEKLAEKNRAAAAKKKPAGRRETPKQPPSGRKGKLPKREGLTFEVQEGLPLTTGSGSKAAVVVPTYPKTPIPSVRPATTEDLFLLFGEDPKNPGDYKQTELKQNIRVPVGKQPGGFGDFTYMYDHHEQKNVGAVKENEREYSNSHHRAAAVRKFIRIAEISKHIQKLDAALKRDYKDNDAAGAVLLMRILAMRPSSDAAETRVILKDEDGEVIRGANGKPLYSDPIRTFGATTLLRRHIEFDPKEPNTVTISLTGKAAHEIKIKTNDPHVVALLKAKMKQKGNPDDKLFNTNGAKTGAYIKSTIGIGSSKDMRTYVATELGTQAVAAIDAEGRTPTTIKEFNDRVTDVTETTANQLQHAPNMSKNSYVSPHVFYEWAMNIPDFDWELFEKPIKGNNRLMVLTPQGKKIREKYEAEQAAKQAAAHAAAQASVKTSRARRKK